MSLKQILKSRRIYDHEVAAAVGVSRQTVNSWKNGRSQPHGKHLGKLQQYLAEKWGEHVTFEDLFGKAA